MKRSWTQTLIDRFCPRSRRRSYALGHLDVKLEGHLKFRGGVFVEAGANDGVRQSNTLYFERYLGWKGLLIEPVPRLAERCRQNRWACAVENCALVSSTYASPEIEISYCDLMSLVKGSRADPEEEARHLALGGQFLKRGEVPQTLCVPAKTLSRVLDEHRMDHVDFLSLDVEGYEPEVLRGIDFSRHRPVHVLIEVRDRKSVEEILSPWYREVAVLSRNDVYEDIIYTSKKP